MAHVEYRTLSDSEICNRIKQSDHLAYTEIYHRYFDPIFRHAYEKLRDEEVAKDMVQDVFVNLWVKRASYNIDINPKGYLFTSVRNRIFNFWAMENVRSAYWNSFPDGSHIEHYINAGTDFKIREQELSTYIDLQIRNFSPRMREIFELSRKEQFSHREIAERLNTTEANVSKQIGNALKLLRTKIGTITSLLLILFIWLVFISDSHYIISIFNLVEVIYHLLKKWE